LALLPPHPNRIIGRGGRRLLGSEYKGRESEISCSGFIFHLFQLSGRGDWGGEGHPKGGKGEKRDIARGGGGK